ncbi:MAG: tetratricopeptide repeat protein [Pseudomonadota bacterium]
MSKRARWLAAAGVMAFLAACDTAEERAAEHLRNGLALVEAGESARAQVEFRNVVKLLPDNIEARYQIASHLKSQNNMRGAVGQLRSIIELDPDNVRARRDMAEIMLIAEQMEESRRHVEVAFGLAPDEPMVRAVKASVDYKLDKTDEAIDMARGVLEEAPDNVIARLVMISHALEAELIEDALDEADAGLEFSPRDLSLNMVRLGLLEQKEDVDGIGEQLKALVEYFPQALQFREALARWHVFKKQFDEAEAQYRALSEADPENAERKLDVVRFLNMVHGEARAREELEALAQQPGSDVDYGLALSAMDLRAGDEAAGVARLDALIGARGESAGADKARLERAKIHIRAEEFDQADALLAGVLTRDPQNHQALTLRASRYLAADLPEEAISDLRTALDVAPEDVSVILMIAEAYERNGNSELSQERLAEAVQLTSFDVNVTLRYVRSLLADDKLEVSERLLRNALAENGENRDLLMALGQVHIEQENWREAEAVGGRLRILDPDDQAAERMEAAALLGRREFEAGTEVLASLLEQTPDNPGSVVSFARALLAAGEVDRAEAFLNERLEADPDEVVSLLLLASVKSAVGELDEAEALLKRVIELAPQNAAAYANLARIYNSQGREAELQQIISRGLELSDNAISLRVTQAMQMEAQGDVKEAIEIYEDLYSLRPNSAIIANNLASLLADHFGDDPATVERAYNIAKRFRNADQPYLQDTYGWLLFLTGDAGNAAPLVLEAAEALPTNPTVQYHAGMVLIETGQLAQARQRLERALELGTAVRFSKDYAAREGLERIDALEASGSDQGSATQ